MILPLDERDYRAMTTITVCCFAPEDVFAQEWDDIAPHNRKMIEERGSIPCEGGGVPGAWCYSEGMELDAWICENILGFWKAANWHWSITCGEIWEWKLEPPTLTPEIIGGRCRLAEDGDRRSEFYAVLLPKVSTTHAYHRVMEAMRTKGYEWQIDVCTRYVQAQLRKHAGVWDLAVWDEPDIEAAVAEVVCQITWKAEGGER